jgi:hypothetical protein
VEPNRNQSIKLLSAVIAASAIVVTGVLAVALAQERYWHLRGKYVANCCANRDSIGGDDNDRTDQDPGSDGPPHPEGRPAQGVLTPTCGDLATTAELAMSPEQAAA